MLLAFFVSTFIVISGFHSHYLRLLVKSSDSDSFLTFAFSVITQAYSSILLDKACKRWLWRWTRRLQSLSGTARNSTWRYKTCLLQSKSPFCDLLKDWFSFLFTLGLTITFTFQRGVRLDRLSPIHLLCWFSVSKVYVCTHFSKIVVTYIRAA